MRQAREGDTVKVQYHGTLSDGTVFDSASREEPLEFTLGNQVVISGFESAVLGMEVGEKKRVSVAPEEGFGRRRTELVMPLDRSDIPDHIELKVGKRLGVRSSEGTGLYATIIDISEETVTLDANHPLADKELTYEIELLEIT